MSRGVRLALTVVLGCVLIAVLAIFGLKSSGSAAKGKPAHELPAEHLSGAAVTLPSLLRSAHGHPALVVFWASWCGPCNHEAPALERFSRSSEGQGRVVGVDWSDERSGATAFIHHFRWTFPNVRDGNGVVGNDYELTSLPTTFVLDSSGRIRRTLHGPQNEASWRQALRAVETA